MQRKKTAAAVKKAIEGYEMAPLHIKAMTSMHVTPLLEALRAIDEELRVVQMMHTSLELLKARFDMHVDEKEHKNG